MVLHPCSPFAKKLNTTTVPVVDFYVRKKKMHMRREEIERLSPNPNPTASSSTKTIVESQPS